MSDEKPSAPKSTKGSGAIAALLDEDLFRNHDQASPAFVLGDLAGSASRARLFRWAVLYDTHDSPITPQRHRRGCFAAPHVMATP